MHSIHMVVVYVRVDRVYMCTVQMSMQCGAAMVHDACMMRDGASFQIPGTYRKRFALICSKISNHKFLDGSHQRQVMKVPVSNRRVSVLFHDVEIRKIRVLHHECGGA